MMAAARLFGAFPPVLLATLGVLLLTVMDAVVKGQMQEHPVLVSICLRFLMGGVFALAAIAIARPPVPDAAQIKANLARLPLVLLTAGSFFTAISLLPLAEAISLSFLAPCFIAVLGVLWLKEAVSRTIVIAIAAGFLGMLVMLWPKLQAGVGGSTLGVGLAVFSAFAYAVNIILLRKLAVSQHPTIIVAFQCIGPGLILSPFAWWLWSSPGLDDLLMFLLAGALGTSGHLMLTHAFSKATAARIAPTEYTSLVWAALLGLVFFNEMPTIYTFAGSALIVAGSLALARK